MASPSKSQCNGTTATARPCSVSPTTFRSATAARTSDRFAHHRNDAGDQQVHRRKRICQKAKVETSGDDMREGLTCVLSVKVPEPKFSSQTKDKLVSSEVQPVVQGKWWAPISRKYLLENPSDAKTICGKIVQARRRAKPPQGTQELTRDAKV